MIKNLQGRTRDFATFDDEGFDQSRFEAKLTGNYPKPSVCRYWIYRLQASFLFGYYEQALDAGNTARPLVWSVVAYIPYRDFYLYYALTLAALFDQATPEQQQEWQLTLKAHQEQLRRWSQINPQTFRHIDALVSAEIARIGGRADKAARLYEESLWWAREGRFIQDEALAYELAARFYQTRGFQTIAELYLREARLCYARWGADGKVQQLDLRYPQLRNQSQFISDTTLGTGAEHLDFLAIVKALQAISGQIVLEQLLDTLMHVVIESAGAQKGYLILVRSEGLSLAAEASIDAQQVGISIHHGQKPSESDLALIHT